MSTNFITRYTAIEAERIRKMDEINAWYRNQQKSFYDDFKAHYGLSNDAVINIETIETMYKWCASMNDVETGLAAITALVTSLNTQL